VIEVINYLSVINLMFVGYFDPVNALNEETPCSN